MRKITQQMINAINQEQNWKLDNTEVVVHRDMDGTTIQVFLHNNCIAEMQEDRMFISTCGWTTRTTFDRLNALPFVSIKRKNGAIYLNGQIWDGKKCQIKLNYCEHE